VIGVPKRLGDEMLGDEMFLMEDPQNVFGGLDPDLFRYIRRGNRERFAFELDIVVGMNGRLFPDAEIKTFSR
jgi:hypothetical protein